jgi:DNA-binding CsgD family transcriptional regulator
VTETTRHAGSPDDTFPGAGTVAERMLVIPRAAVGLGVMACSIFIHDVHVGLILACAAAFVATSVLARHRLAIGDLGAFTWASVADAAACAAFLVVTMQVPLAPSALLFPLLAFELGLKHGQRGSAVALVLLASAIGLRSWERSTSFSREPRLWLIGLLLAATGVFIWIAGTIREQLEWRAAADADRRRLAGLLNDIVAGVLTEAGIGPDDGEHRSLMSLVDEAAEHPEVILEVNRRIAAWVTPRHGVAGIGPLSTREMEVLELLAANVKDRDIAGRLFLSQGTIRVHVSHIVHKLDVCDRVAAVAWFREQRGGSEG